MTSPIFSRHPLMVAVAAGLVALLAFTDANAQSVAFGGQTTTTQTGTSAGVWTVGLSGTPLGFTSTTPTLVNSNPEPWLADSDFTPAVSALAYASDATSGYADLLGSNAAVNDFFSLPGPSFSPSADLVNPFASCDGGSLFSANSVAVDPAGHILGVGNFICGNLVQAIALYQSSSSSWTLADNLNTDTNINPGGMWTFNSIADAVVAPSSNAFLQPGDLVVLIGDSYGGDPASKPVVVRYPQSSIASCHTEAGCGLGQVLLTEAGLPLNGFAPVSIDVSAVDGSLLIATSDGSLWQVPIVGSGEIVTYGTPVLFACVGKAVNNACVTGTGVAWGKIRATQQNGNLYVVATVTQSQSSAGFVGLFYGTSPIQGPVQSVFVANTQPVGLTIPFYKTGTVQAGQCIGMPCDPIGDGVERITIRDYPPIPPAFFPPTATITEQECDALDPRVDPITGLFNGLPLPLVQICPGLSDSTILPGYVRGAAGPPVGGPFGRGLVIIAALADVIALNSDGIEVKIQSTSAPVFPISPTCPQNVHVLGSNDHSQVETTFAEGHNVFENTGFCYTDPGSGSLGPHKTIDGIGLALNLTMFAPNGTPLQQAVKFFDFKNGNLITTIKQTSIKFGWEKAVLLLGAAVDQALVDKGHYDCAAELVYLLDQFVRRHRADFQSNDTPGATVREPNGFADIIGRLANEEVTILSTIEGKTVTWSDWPLTADPHLCHTNECNLSGLDK
jgi:hypothetical protein